LRRPIPHPTPISPCAEVANEPRRAAELIADADQLEDEQSRAHLAAFSDVIFFSRVPDFIETSESAGIIRASSDPADLGIVTGVNAVALRLCG
jgi:PAS domain S-box-containing protein